MSSAASEARSALDMSVFPVSRFTHPYASFPLIDASVLFAADSILKISFPKNMIEERIIKAILMLIMVLPRMKLKGIAETRKFKKLTL